MRSFASGCSASASATVSGGKLAAAPVQGSTGTGKYTGTLSGVEDLTDDSFGNGGLDDEQPVRYYDLNGHQLSQPVRGVNIVRRPDGTTGKVIMR